MKMIALAEADYLTRDRNNNKKLDFWTDDLAGLYLNDGLKLIDRKLAKADAAPVKSVVPDPVPLRGYLYVAIKRQIKHEFPDFLPDSVEEPAPPLPIVPSFRFCAYPAEYGSTGEWTFIINENNTIFKFEQGGEPFKDWPTDVFLAGPFNMKGD